MNDLFQALQDAPFATAIAEGASLFPWIESIHVLAVVAVVGSISIVDLRLIGVMAHRRSIRRLIGEVLPLTWGAFAIAAVSGFLLFSSNAVKYAANGPFRLKMIVLLLAGLNMLAFHFLTHRGAGNWDETGNTPAAAKFAGISSLFLWIMVIFAGRWIGFTLI